MKLAVPDKISPSYFVAEAAVELGFFKAEGLDVSLELVYPVDKAYEALRDGTIDFVGGAAHAVPAAFPGFKGAKLIAAQAQGMYWFLVMRSDLGAKRGDLSVVKGRTIGAAPWVNTGLRGLLIAAGIDLERDKVNIAPVPGLIGDGAEFRRHGVEGARGPQARRLLGQRHGRRGRGARRLRHRRARRAPRRRAEAVLQFYRAGHRRDRTR